MDQPAVNLAENAASKRDTRSSIIWLWLSGIGIVVLFVALRWNNWNASLIRDEGEYFYAAGLLKSGIAPYAHSFLQKPPMIVYTYALATTLVPDSYSSARLLAYVFVAMATVLVGLIGRREFGPGVALPAMLLFTPMVFLPGEEQFAANTEKFLILPLLVLFALFVWNREKGGSATSWCAAGALAAVCIGYKYTIAPLVVIILLFWSDRKRRAAGNAGLFRSWLLGAFGAAVASVAVVGFFAWKGALKDLWHCTIVFNRFYAASGQFGLGGLSHWGKIFLRDWWILFLPVLFLFCQIAKWERRMWLWFALLMTALLSTNLSIYGQYWIILMPFWAILSAVGAREFSDWFAAKTNCPPKPACHVLLAAMLVLVCLSDRKLIFATPKVYSNKHPVLYFNPFPESKLMAQHVAALTSAEDTVYVAGSEPQILVYAHRRSPTRFIIAYPFTIPTPLAAGYQKEVMADLQTNSPKAIVFVPNNMSWLLQPDSLTDVFQYVRYQMRDHYDLIGGTVWKNDVLQWVEPISPADRDHATLLLYRRKP